MVAISIIATTVAMGCGSLAAMTTGTAPDAGTDAPVDGATVDAGVVDSQGAGSPETGATGPCDGEGYFILVGNDAGSQVLRDGCDRALGPNLDRGPCGEDCLCSHIVDCSDASALDLAVGYCDTVHEAGTYPITVASWTNGGATTPTWSGWIRLATLPPSPGPVTGDYSLTFLPTDGGSGDTLGGTFCVQQ